jgi:hypothetical protein
MATERVNNQAVKIYSPTETVFNDEDSGCKWHLDYFPLVTCDDTSEIIINTTIENEDVEKDGDMLFNETGTNTSVVVGTLTDAGASFVVAGVEIGMVVRNITDDTTALVTSVASTVLTLDSDIFGALAKDYSISNYELSGNMTFGTGEMIKTSSSIGSFKQLNILTEDALYKLEIDITSFSTTSPGDQINIKIGGTTILTLDETDNVVETQTVYAYSNGGTPFDVEIEAGIGINATFSTLRVDQMSNVVFFVCKCEDDEVVYTSDPSNVTASNTQGQLKTSFDWSNLQDGYDCQGCYYIKIIDGISVADALNSDRIDNGTFSGAATEWNFGSGWSLSSNKASLSSAGGAGDLSQTSLAYDFSKSINYDVTFTISSYLIGSVDVILKKGALEIANLGNFSANGTYTVSTGVLTDGCDIIVFDPGTGAQTYTIDDVSAVINIENTGYTWRSDCFQLSDKHACTTKLSGTNLDNAFGIDFIGLAYNPVIRISGELETPRYGGDKENEEDSAGVSKTLYYKSEKKRNLLVYLQPEWIHDFIRLLIGYDTLLIDDVAYVSDDASYEPEASRELGRLPDLSTANTELRLKTDLNENRFC